MDNLQSTSKQTFSNNILSRDKVFMAKQMNVEKTVDKMSMCE